MTLHFTSFWIFFYCFTIILFMVVSVISEVVAPQILSLCTWLLLFWDLYSKLTRQAIGSYLNFLDKKRSWYLKLFFSSNINRTSIDICLIRILQTKLSSTFHRTSGSDMTQSIWKLSEWRFTQFDRTGSFWLEKKFVVFHSYKLICLPQQLSPLIPFHR